MEVKIEGTFVREIVQHSQRKINGKNFIDYFFKENQKDELQFALETSEKIVEVTKINEVVSSNEILDAFIYDDENNQKTAVIYETEKFYVIVESKTETVSGFVSQVDISHFKVNKKMINLTKCHYQHF